MTFSDDLTEAGTRAIYREALRRINIMRPLGMTSTEMLRDCLEWDAPVREAVYRVEYVAENKYGLTDTQRRLLIVCAKMAIGLYEIEKKQKAGD